MPSPFATMPHALARRAAQIVAGEIEAGNHPFEHDFDEAGQGKMFGVLVVMDRDSRVGFVRGVSGMLGGQWIVEGFAPPLFDLPDREAFWPEGQTALAEIEQQLQSLMQGSDARGLAAEAAEMKARHDQSLEDLRARHRGNKQKRAQLRARLLVSEEDRHRARKLHELAQESRANRREGKTLRKEQQREWQRIESRQKALEAERQTLRRQRASVSNHLLKKIQKGYAIANAVGQETSLASLFAPQEPPGGSGDCAAPKLLGYAHRQTLRPLALAEFWWGAPPIGGGRHARHFYPPCRSKCGPILPFLLQGIAHEEAPLYATLEFATDQPLCVFEDESIVVVNKPSGMLSVPGAHSRLQDSALTRLRARYPQVTGPLLAHRLDLDTSGLLVMAKSLEVYRALQARFAARQVHKRYVAWVDGEVEQDEGEIRLALRVDLEDRPRQIYDPKHGKEAITGYQVLERRGAFTKLALMPRTGRTHQLRVHAAHDKGLGAPIVGDRLYGKGQGRLLLHAESLRFTHPKTGVLVDFRCPLPEPVAQPGFSSISMKL